MMRRRLRPILKLEYDDAILVASGVVGGGRWGTRRAKS
jgi:hypothetical protein